MSKSIQLKNQNENVYPHPYYPVGSIYLSVVNTNPSTWFGGTWEQIAKGRTLVGVDTSDTDFNTVQKTGGEKKHQLTKAEIPNHIHYGTSDSINDGFVMHATGGAGYTVLQQTNSGYGVYIGGATNSVGDMGNGSHNNLQLYFTCYIWCRTA